MSKIKNFALIGIGLVLGIGVSFAPDIHAATSKLLGGKVAKVITVKKNGKVIGEGGIINNTTYLPVRTVVNSINGIEVGSVSSSEINLVTTDEGDPDVSTGTPTEPTPIVDNSDQIRVKISELDGKIGEVKMKISNAENVISSKESALSFIKTSQEMMENMEKLKASGSPLYNEDQYNGYKQRIETMQNNINTAEHELPALKQQLADLEKQKQELQSQLPK